MFFAAPLLRNTTAAYTSKCFVYVAVLVLFMLGSRATVFKAGLFHLIFWRACNRISLGGTLILGFPFSSVSGYEFHNYPALARSDINTCTSRSYVLKTWTIEDTKPENRYQRASLGYSPFVKGWPPLSSLSCSFYPKIVHLCDCAVMNNNLRGTLPVRESESVPVACRLFICMPFIGRVYCPYYI